MSVTVSPSNYVCECCGLWYPVPQPVANDVETRMHRRQANRVPTRCTRCSHHEGDDAETLVRRAHVYWEHYKRAVEATRAMRAEVERAETRASDYRDRMFAAFRSRDRGIRLLRRIGDLHEPLRGGCSCGKKPDCETSRVMMGRGSRGGYTNLHDERHAAPTTITASCLRTTPRSPSVGYGQSAIKPLAACEVGVASTKLCRIVGL
jgi:hypothetical protein